MEQTLLAFSHATGIYDVMNTPWGWPTAESLHFIGMSLLIGTVGTFDLRLLGAVKNIPLQAMHRLVPIGICGYLLNVTTGIMFLTTVPDQYIYNPAFQTKLSFMGLAGINMLLFYRFSFAVVKQQDPVPAAMLRARIGALVSLACWFGVITCGRLITFYRPPYYWCFWCS